MVNSTRYSARPWIVVGVEYVAYDCDCSPVNYGSEIQLRVRAGTYGRMCYRTVEGCFTSATTFCGGDEVLTLA